MEWRIEPVTVSIEEKDNNRIVITQDDYGDGEHKIILQPDQIDILIQWLKEAKEKVVKLRAG